MMGNRVSMEVENIAGLHNLEGFFSKTCVLYHEASLHGSSSESTFQEPWSNWNNLLVTSYSFVVVLFSLSFEF